MIAIRSTAPRGAMLWQELIQEARRLLRDPAFVLPSIGFPLAFYLLFTQVLPMGGSTATAQLLTFANFSVFGVFGSMWFGTALTLATDRDLGVLKLKRATPLPLSIYFLGKLGGALLLTVATVAVLTLAAALVGGLRLSADTWLALIAVWLFGAACIGPLGMAIGAWFGGNAAPGVVNLLFLPLAALGGLWFPLALMPELLRSLAWLMPTFHFGELTRVAVGLSDTSWLALGACLAAWATIGSLLTLAGLKRRPF